MTATGIIVVKRNLQKTRERGGSFGQRPLQPLSLARLEMPELRERERERVCERQGHYKRTYCMLLGILLAVFF